MIGIEVKGVFLDLGKETIRFEKINPSFITELFQGDYSFPFTIPATENNLKALGFSNIIEVVNRTIKEEIYLWWFGMAHEKAILVVSAGTESSIKINIAGGVKAMRIADKNLKDLTWPADFTLGTNSDSIITNAKIVSLESDWAEYGFSFIPHKNEEFYSSSNPDFNGIVNKQNSSNGDFYKNTVMIGNKYCLVPFLFLFYILNQIFIDEGLIPEGEFWDDEEMQKILVYNNYALDSPNNDDNVYVITNVEHSYNTTTRLKLYKGPAGTFDAAGAWSNSAFEYTIQQAGDITIDVLINAYVDARDTLCFGLYTPHFNLYIDGVLAGQLNFPSQSYGYFSRSLTYTYTASIGDIGKKIYINNIVDPVYLPLTGLIFRVLGTSYCLISNTSELLNVYSNTITFKNHVNDMTASEFLVSLKTIGIDIRLDYNTHKAILNFDKSYVKSEDYDDLTKKVTDKYDLNFEDKDKGYKINYDFGSSDKLVETNFKKYLASNFKGEVETYKMLPTPAQLGFIMLVLNVNQLFITSPNPSGSGYIWEFFSDNYYDVILGRGEQELKCKFAPMFMAFAENEGGTATQNKCLIPAVKQSGSSQMFGLGSNDFNLRFVFYRGVNQDHGLPSPEGGSYVYAGTSVFGINGDRVGNYEWRINSTFGLIDILLMQLLIALTNSEIVERDVNLNELDILSFNVKRKAVIDDVVFLIKSMSILGDSNLRTSRGKFLKL